MAELTVSFSAETMWTPARWLPSALTPGGAPPAGYLFWLQSCGLALSIGCWSLGLELQGGPSSAAGWVCGRNALPVWVVQGGARLPGSDWGQLVALSTGLSPVAPRGLQEPFIST